MGNTVASRHDNVEGPPWRMLPPERIPEDASEAEGGMGKQVTLDGEARHDVRENR